MRRSEHRHFVPKEYSSVGNVNRALCLKCCVMSIVVVCGLFVISSMLGLYFFYCGTGSVCARLVHATQRKKKHVQMPPTIANKRRVHQNCDLPDFRGQSSD